MEHAFYEDNSADIELFGEHIKRTTTIAEVPHAYSIESNIPMYRAPELTGDLTGAKRAVILSEWTQVLGSGAGVLVLSGMMQNIDALDAASETYRHILEEEAQASAGKGDHFAAVGSNSRIWNSSQKLCMKSPEVFAR